MKNSKRFGLLAYFILAGVAIALHIRLAGSREETVQSLTQPTPIPRSTPSESLQEVPVEVIVALKARLEQAEPERSSVPQPSPPPKTDPVPAKTPAKKWEPLPPKKLAKTNKSSPSADLEKKRSFYSSTVISASPGQWDHRIEKKNGERLIGHRGEHLGKFPLLELDYRSIGGWEEYARLCGRLGGRFFILDSNREKIIAAIDLATGDLAPVGCLSGFSPRSREIVDDFLWPLILKAKKQFGPEDYSVALLLPLSLDQFIYGCLQDLLQTNYGVDLRMFEAIQGQYQIVGEQYVIRVTTGKDKEGNTVRFNLDFPIGIKA